MKRKDAFTKVLAVAGALLAWFPLLAPVALSVAFLVATGEFRFDYLMPAELFPFTLAGGGLLFWAAWRAGAYRKPVGGGLVLAGVFLVSAQGLAVLTGLASGETKTGGWQWVLVLGLLALFILSLLAVGAGGILLLRDLFRPRRD